MAHPGPGDQKTLDCPVNTMSDWGWHTTPVAKSLTPTANVSAWRSQELTTYNHTSAYPTGCGGAFEGDAASCPAAQKQSAYSYLRANPHRLNLGRLFLASNASADLSNEIADALSRLDAPEASQLPASCFEAVRRDAPRRGPKWYRLPSAHQRPDLWGAGEEAEPTQAWRHVLCRGARLAASQGAWARAEGAR